MSSIVLDLEQIRTDIYGVTMVCLEATMLKQAHDGIGPYLGQTEPPDSEEIHVPRSAVVQIHGMVGTVTRICREVHCQP